ncbi:MAG: hypothetical protein IKT98_06495 [Selenomonadaceae bacterium]|nr:hypothetical protein [Selenomonadaceae bacterium]
MTDESSKALSDFHKLTNIYLARRRVAKDYALKETAMNTLKSADQAILKRYDTELYTAAQSFVASYEEHDIRGDNNDG